MLYIFEKQIELNRRINPKLYEDIQTDPELRRKWFLNFELALKQESAEAVDSLGWKWWKKQEPDWEQVRLELIDIWHFGLSDLLLSHSSEQEIVNLVSKAFSQALPQQDFKLSLESFTEETLAEKSFDVLAFHQLATDANLSFDDLFLGYVCKNVLNFFRQDHGYKDGTYVKNWGVREDNEHLVELSKELDANSVTFKDDLYQALKARYVDLCE